MLKTIEDVISRVVGTRFEREMKQLQPIVEEIHDAEERVGEMSEEELKAQTEKFRERVRGETEPIEERIAELRDERRHTEDPGRRENLTSTIEDAQDEYRQVTDRVLDELLPEAFATVREACRRLLGTEIEVTGNTMEWDMVPYDVQLIGAIVLHQGRIAEMSTGEGKTLVATMPLYLNALPGDGAHLVTVNDYLARRDAQWMGTVYEYLEMTVECIDEYDPGSEARKEAYEADITYGTNNEFGFDYLRDNMVVRLEDRVQRGHNYAIIDEIDSVLIDEARTPLIISGPAQQDDNRTYERYNSQVANLVRKQQREARQLLSEAEDLLEEVRSAGEDEDVRGKRFEAGRLLLAVQKGTPKNRRLQKLLNQSGVQQLVQSVEDALMREKRLHEVDEMLLYSTDEKGHTIQLSDQGLEVLSPGDPDAFTVPDISEKVKEIEEDEDLSPDRKRERLAEVEEEYAEKSEKIHVVHQLVKAHALYEKDVEYVVEDGQVVIVDEFTGRKMPGRRWSDGLHQAVEAKEGVSVQGETQTLASITIQNYFRMYDKLAGMTGTAETEEGEFMEIYDLDVVVIPTNRPDRRVDQDDLIFQTKREKYAALLDEIERLHRQGLPTLVGTTSVEVSEKIARMLKRRGLDHEVLNAKNHEREAQIVANAGQPGAITIATNMAGRGTDIKLGPGVVKCQVCGIESEKPAFGQVREEPDLTDAQVAELGCQTDPPCGLQILGTERHESRRIDRQLRGRSGRQGDPGSARFFLSLEDDLMRLFGSDRIAKVMDKMGAEEGEVITHPWVTKSIEKAQRRVEMQNFEARKKLLEYDDVNNQQREVIYDLRLFALQGGDDLKGEAWEMIDEALRTEVENHVPPGSRAERWDLAGLREALLIDYFLLADFLPEEEQDSLEARSEWSSPREVEEQVVEFAHEAYDQKLESFGEEAGEILRFIVLSVIDDKWKDHLYDLDQLRDSIRYRAYGQRDPEVEYKKEAFGMFVDLMRDIRKSVANLVFRAQVEREAQRLRAPEITEESGPSDSFTTGVSASDVTGDGGEGGGEGGGAGRREMAATGVSAAAKTGDGGTARADSPRVVQPEEPLEVDEEPGRNDPCPCGSGDKYKNCHGSLV